MASAMRLLGHLPENNWRDPRPNERVPPPANQLHHDGVNAPAMGVHELTLAQLNPGPKRYSNALVNLVWDCLRHDPTQRPSADNLLTAINANANFQGMDTATAATLTAAQREFRIDLDREQYTIGSLF